MAVDIIKTIGDSVMAPFRDMQLLLVLVLWGIVVFAIGYLSLPSIFNAVYSLSAAAYSSPTAIIGSVFSLLSIVAVLMVASIIIGVFFINMVLAKAFYGKKYSLEKAASFAISRYLSVFGTEILLFILFLVVPALVIGVVAIASSALGVLLMFLYIIFAIYAAVKLSVSIPAALVGKKNPVEAIKYSWTITANKWWTLFATFLAIFIIALIITYIASIPSSMILRHGIASQISNYATPTTATGNSSALLGSVFTAMKSNVHTTSYAIADLITQIVGVVMQSWLMISTILIYGQLAPKSKTKNSK